MRVCVCELYDCTVCAGVNALVVVPEAAFMSQDDTGRNVGATAPQFLCLNTPCNITDPAKTLKSKTTRQYNKIKVQFWISVNQLTN